MRVIQGALVVVLLLLAVPPAGLARREPPKIPTIKEIMQEAHRGPTAYILEVRKELSRENTDWPVVEQKGKDLVRMGRLLAMNTPPKGSKESWRNYADVYVASATK